MSVPPQEENVLGAMLLSEAAIVAVRETGLVTEDFYRHGHGVVYEQAIAMFEASLPVDALLLVDRLEQTGKLEAAGGLGRVHELAALVPATSNAAHYAKIVVEAAHRRALVAAASEITNAATDGGVGPELAERVKALLGRTAGSGREGWLFDAADLLAEPDPGPTRWLVENLIVEQAIVAAVGKWKTLKSYVQMHVAICIATGRRVFDTLAVEEPGAVVYVIEESGREALWRRLDGLCRGYEVDPEEFRGRLHFATNERVKLDDPAWQAELIERGRKLRPRLFVFDPLARMKAAGRKENDQSDMAVVVEFLRVLRDETGAAVCFVHHTGHHGENMRGSSDFESLWETRLTFTRGDDNEPGEKPKRNVVTLKSEHREADTSSPIKFRAAWDEVARSMRFKLNAAKPAAEEKASAASIAEFVRGNDGSATPSEIKSKFEVSDDTLRRRRDELEGLGVTYIVDGRQSRYEARDPAPRDPATSRGKPIAGSQSQSHAETDPAARNPATTTAAG